MRETRLLDIKKKIFTKSNILNIGRVFLSEYQSAQQAGNHSSVAFKINCADGTSYESESIVLFEEGNVIDLKRTSSLEITFYDYKLNRYINISIIHGCEYRNHLIVRGDDQNWVNGVFIRLKEIIDSIRPQDNFLIKHKTLILHFGLYYTGIWNLLKIHLKP